MQLINDREFYQRYEIIGGEKIMAPAAPLNHSSIIMRLAIVIGNYTIKNNCGYVFPDNTDVHLPDGSLFSPDLVVITQENTEIMSKQNAIYGVPDMVVEVFSRSTRNRDLNIKKNSYEACGVKEYWTIDPWAKAVDVYLLRDGKYYLDGEYQKLEDYEWDTLTEEGKAEIKTEITLSIFPELTVKLDDIFAWCF